MIIKKRLTAYKKIGTSPFPCMDQKVIVFWIIAGHNNYWRYFPMLLAKRFGIHTKSWRTRHMSIRGGVNYTVYTWRIKKVKRGRLLAILTEFARKRRQKQQSEVYSWSSHNWKWDWPLKAANENWKTDAQLAAFSVGSVTEWVIFRISQAR